MGMPSNIGYGRVVGRLIRAMLDGPDVDETPDGVPIPNATVTFTADVTHARNRHAVPPVMVFFDPVVVETDSDGMIVTRDGQAGIWLVATDDTDIDPMIGAYVVTVSAPSIPRLSWRIAVPEGETVDLATAIPVPNSPVADIAEWVRVRGEVIQARDETVAAASDSASAASLSEQAADRAETAEGLSRTYAQAASEAQGQAQAAQSAAEAARDGAVSAMPHIIVGVGRPDITGTLAPDVAIRVAAATSGTVFRSTDGPQGAWEWRKRGTAWVCEVGDTGWVTSNSLDTAIRAAWPEYPPDSIARVGHLRRRPGQVDCWLGSGGGGVLNTRRDFTGGPGTLPSWARPDNHWNIATTPDIPNLVRIQAGLNGRFEIIGNWTGYSNTGISWPVASNLDWPTTLTI